MSKVIVIDAGHGINTAGKRCAKNIDPGETREWVLNSRVADKLQAALSAYDCTVIRADDITGKTDVPLAKRVAISNNAKADMYISIHHNAGGGSGTIVYFYSSKAERNRQATDLYNAVVKSTGLVGNRAQKVIKNGFYVIKNTNAPAFLLENGFMDNGVDTPIILTSAHAEKTAKGILNFLIKELQLKRKDGENGADTKPQEYSTFYPKCAQEYTTIADALYSIGVDSSYSHRKKIAAVNGIKWYVGTAAQNTQMLNLLKNGMLKKA